MDRVLAREDAPGHTYAEYRYLIGHGIRNLVTESLPAELRSEERIARCYERMIEDYGRNSLVKTHVYEGVPELVRELRAGAVPLAIHSNKSDELTRAHRRGAARPCRLRRRARGAAGRAAQARPGGRARHRRTVRVPPARIVYLGDSLVDMRTADGGRDDRGRRLVGVPDARGARRERRGRRDRPRRSTCSSCAADGAGRLRSRASSASGRGPGPPSGERARLAQELDERRHERRVRRDDGRSARRGPPAPARPRRRLRGRSARRRRSPTARGRAPSTRPRARRRRGRGRAPPCRRGGGRGCDRAPRPRRRPAARGATRRRRSRSRRARARGPSASRAWIGRSSQTAPCPATARYRRPELESSTTPTRGSPSTSTAIEAA